MDQRRCTETAKPRLGASTEVCRGIMVGAAAVRYAAASAPAMGCCERIGWGAGMYKVCGRSRTHHASNRLQTTRSKRSMRVGACAVVAVLLGVTAALIPP
jgi:hypothetical protein